MQLILESEALNAKNMTEIEQETLETKDFHNGIDGDLKSKNVIAEDINESTDTKIIATDQNDKESQNNLSQNNHSKESSKQNKSDIVELNNLIENTELSKEDTNQLNNTTKDNEKLITNENQDNVEKNSVTTNCENGDVSPKHGTKEDAVAMNDTNSLVNGDKCDDSKVSAELDNNVLTDCESHNNGDEAEKATSDVKIERLIDELETKELNNIVKESVSKEDQGSIKILETSEDNTLPEQLETETVETNSVDLTPNEDLSNATNDAELPNLPEEQNEDMVESTSEVNIDQTPKENIENLNESLNDIIEKINDDIDCKPIESAITVDENTTALKIKEDAPEQPNGAIEECGQELPKDVNVSDVTMEVDDNLCESVKNDTVSNESSAEIIDDDIFEIKSPPKEKNIENSHVNEKSEETENELVDKKSIETMEKENSEKSTVTSGTENIIKNTTSEVKSSKVSETRRSFSGLSNTLDILSDDEEDNKVVTDSVVNKTFNIEDDDDVMLVDDVTPKDTDSSVEKITMEDKNPEKITEPIQGKDETHDVQNVTETSNENKLIESTEKSNEKEEVTHNIPDKIEINEKQEVKETTTNQKNKPIVPENFLKAFKLNVADMTRDELEEFCLVKIVEGVIDRSNLSDIKSKLKTMSQSIDEWRKKTMLLSKQNRDLQIVLKTVQEEQKKKTSGTITPLKITRSVGMQVYMADTTDTKRKSLPMQNRNVAKPQVNNQASTPRPQKPNSNQQIPYPKLVPALAPSPAKTRPTTPQVQNSTVSSNTTKPTTPNGVKNVPTPKSADKRPFSSVQSVTVDLTDDEPPTKQLVTPRNAPQPPVRLVSPQHLLAPRPPIQTGPRKVFIPINSQNSPSIRPGQTIMLKSCPPPPNIRTRMNTPMVRLPPNTPGLRMPRVQNQRHPAPLPDVPKQPQPPNWKNLPPAPDLKISKVENGIVISWKIEGYQEDNYEKIASYQLYAYQETSTAPNTSLWKKIGDVKALPLPMACTLTQFMAGYKYYFAVRAVDIRSRIGLFSLPGSILLLNK